MSSDSEDDCYGNIAQKLQNMKNNFREDKIETTHLLNDSIEDTKELDDIIKKAKLGGIKKKKSPAKKAPSVDVLLEKFTETTGRRITRAAAKRSTSVTEINVEVPSEVVKGTGRNRGRGRKSAQMSEPCAMTAPRGRGRGRTTSRGRNRGQPSQRSASNQNIPTYSVGNTDEYPDYSDSQALFTTNTKSDTVVLDDNEDIENEELSVKVYWQSSEIFKFTLRKFQKLTQIFEYFSKKEDIRYDKLLFTYNDRILKIDDTPDSMDYNIAKFIDGGVVNQSVLELVRDDGKSEKCGARIKFQCENVKKPFETVIGWDEKLSLALIKCAEHFEKPIDQLKFEFDGDLVSGKDTPKELDFEGGECIDVKILSL